MQRVSAQSQSICLFVYRHITCFGFIFGWHFISHLLCSVVSWSPVIQCYPIKHTASSLPLSWNGINYKHIYTYIQKNTGSSELWCHQTLLADDDRNDAIIMIIINLRFMMMKWISTNSCQWHMFIDDKSNLKQIKMTIHFLFLSILIFIRIIG